MRRGLISWSREEMPATVLDQRVAQLQARMRAEKLDTVLAYTSFAQPAPVHWLTNFTPYWSEAMLVVFQDGAPLLLASLTKRVHQWIREVCHIGDVLMVPRLGEGTARLLTEKIGASARIGVIGLNALPWSVAEPLFANSAGSSLIDASALFTALRQPSDEAERKLAAQATAIARAALDAAPAGARMASDVTAAIEASARLAGAEEVLQRIAPDLDQATVLQRMEGDVALGRRYAVELSLAYKGAWIRLARSVRNEAPADADADVEPASLPRTWQAADRWFVDTVARMDEIRDGQLPLAPPGQLLQWSLEASVGIHPLGVTAAKDMMPAQPLPADSLAVFSVRLALEDGHWYRAAPLIVGKPGTAGALLAG